MTAQPCIVALEGPCCAGKTTLGRLLIQELCELAVTFVPCYADHAGGGRYLPRQETDTVAEREQALRQLLLIEAGRLAQVPQACDVILEDRSVHTLLAHSYALQRKTGIDFLTPSTRLLRSSPVPAWPGLVLYLDLPQDTDQGGTRAPPARQHPHPRFHPPRRPYIPPPPPPPDPPAPPLSSPPPTTPPRAPPAPAHTRQKTAQDPPRPP